MERGRGIIKVEKKMLKVHKVYHASTLLDVTWKPSKWVITKRKDDPQCSKTIEKLSQIKAENRFSRMVGTKASLSKLRRNGKRETGPRE